MSTNLRLLRAEFAKVDIEHTANAERVRLSANRREELRKKIEAAEAEQAAAPEPVESEPPAIERDGE
mgnify:CR=1 FL=1